MQTKNQLLEQLGESYGYFSVLVDRKIEAYKLTVAERSALTAAGIVAALVLTLLGFAAVLFGLIALAFYLAGDMDSAARGFGWVSLLLVGTFLLVLALRRFLIVNPIIAKVIDIFFAEDKDPDHE
ncbi:hypothetical protein QWY85_01745 [Neolewinella lacunae]|uniref:Phage holin family protein n=1 Tax=Neolewinella lacunae TaxID=1517758 RepID=A0A923PHZ1_9BACT|nr:hypothetical protein [Neolewinella lacunae]MBC6994425.1 hypothetical protein [Neolewinella lacunae]MDN3633361.1 hypothetical protein [Neolewinella lacunae]